MIVSESTKWKCDICQSEVETNLSSDDPPYKWSTLELHYNNGGTHKGWLYTAHACPQCWGVLREITTDKNEGLKVSMVRRFLLRAMGRA